MFQTDYDRNRMPHLPRIVIETVPHDEQRYETCGDWYYENDGSLVIKVSQTNSKYELLIALHELVESVLCGLKGINEIDVTNFDVEFENMRRLYPSMVADSEPGDNEAAPYFHEHQMANRLENWLADSTLEDKNDYVDTINNLGKSVV